MYGGSRGVGVLGWVGLETPWDAWVCGGVSVGVIMSWVAVGVVRFEMSCWCGGSSVGVGGVVRSCEGLIERFSSGVLTSVVGCCWCMDM